MGDGQWGRLLCESSAFADPCKGQSEASLGGMTEAPPRWSHLENSRFAGSRWSLEIREPCYWNGHVSANLPGLAMVMFLFFFESKLVTLVEILLNYKSKQLNHKGNALS